MRAVFLEFRRKKMSKIVTILVTIAAFLPTLSYPDKVDSQLSHFIGVGSVSARTRQRLLRYQSVTTTEKYIKKINNDLESTVSLLSNDNKKTKKGINFKVLREK